MNEEKSLRDRLLEQVGLIMARPGESKLMYLGATKDVVRINSKGDKIYNELLDQVMDSINHDNTIMLTRKPTENSISEVMQVPMRGIKSESNKPERKTGRQSNVVVSYSDMEQDKARLAESDRPRDKVKLAAIDRIEKEFNQQIAEAEANNDTLKAQELKHKKNISWSIIKDEIDGKTKARPEVETVLDHAEQTTHQSTYIEPWQELNEERIDDVTKYVLDSKDKYTDVETYQVRADLKTSAFGSYSKDLKAFMDLQENGSRYFTYDIETIGNALNSNRFSVVEIAAQGYERGADGKFRMSDEKFTSLIELMPEEQKQLKKVIASLKKDKYSFNALDDAYTRSIVDLMRYSTIDHSKERLRKDLVHNPVISRVFGENEKILTEYMFENMDEMIRHMESGLENLTYRADKDNIVMSYEEAQKAFNGFVQKNNDATFVGHNSNRFDDRKLKEWHSGPAEANLQNKIVLPEKRMDFLNVVQAAYPDPRILLQSLYEQRGHNGEIIYEQGYTRLYEFQKALDLLTDTKHSALADVADEGLGGVLSKAMDTIYADIEAGRSDTTNQGVTKVTGKIQWSDTFLKTGQVLYADQGYVNRDKVSNIEAKNQGPVGKELKASDIDTSKVDLSFMAEYDAETGTFNRITSDFNSVIINSKSFYEVQGIQALENGRMALRLYDREQDRYSFIVREGENAVEQLEEFVQGRFHIWNNNGKKEKQRIIKDRKQDIARRRYDKMFSLSRSDMGKTGGYQSASRYYKALEIYEKRVEGKNLNIEQQAKANVLEKHQGKKLTPKKLEKLVNKEKQRLRNERMSHEQFTEQMKAQFMTTWNPETKEWEFNQQEMEDFFAMRKRLASEREVFEPMIQAIEKEYGSELDRLLAEVNAATPDSVEFNKAKQAYVSMARQADAAWISYVNDLDHVVENLHEKKEILKPQHQRRQFKVADGDKERTINAYDFNTAKSTVSAYAYGGLSHIKDDEKRKAMAKERLYNMVEEINKSGIVTRDVYDDMIDAIIKNEVTHNAVIAVSKVISEAEDRATGATREIGYTNGDGEHKIKEVKTGIYFDKRIEVPKMEGYELKVTKDQDYIKLLASQHIENAKTFLDFAPAGPNDQGRRYVFNSQMEELLERLDSFEHVSGLKTNNRKAVEDLVESILSEDPSKTIAFSFDKYTNNLMVSVGKDLDNSVMIREINEGKLPSNALNLAVPLIGNTGTHRIGERTINAKSYWDYDDNTKLILERSSAEEIVEHYTKNMSRLLSQLNYSSADHAQDTARKILNEASKSLAGIQRGSVSVNDTNYFSNNFGDFLKQSHVDVQSALIKQLYYDGLGGLKLTHEDFANPKALFDENGKFKGRVTVDDLSFNSQYKTYLALENFISENSADLYMSGVKDDSSAGRKLSKIDVRVLGAFRDFIAQTRSNSIQEQNAVILEPEVIEKLNAIRESGSAFITTDKHVTTDMNIAFDKHWRSIQDSDGNRVNDGKALSFDMKVMYMNDKDVYDRLQDMLDTAEGEKVLSNEGMLITDKDGNIVRNAQGRAKLDPSSTARVYEQQIIFNKDIAEALKGRRTKAFHDVRASRRIRTLAEEGKETIKIQPGEVLGFDKDGKAVTWNKDIEATASIQNGKLLVDWEEDLFKLQVGGEKGTINPFSREFMEMFTGTTGVAAVMNPNVLKHKDLGMLYESKAGLFAQRARELAASGNKKLLGELNAEVLKLGLEWDADNQRYIERARKHFADRDMDYTLFNKILNDERFGLEGSVFHLSNHEKALKEKLLAERLELETKPIPTAMLSEKQQALEQARRNKRISEIDKEIAGLGKKFEVGVLNTVASAVYNYSRAIDGTGMEVVSQKTQRLEYIDELGNLRTEEYIDKVYAQDKGMRGITWGHRELAALRQKGLDATADKMIQQMLIQGGMEQVEDTVYLSENSKRINRIQEQHNMLETIEQMIKGGDGATAVNIFDGRIKGLPEVKGTAYTMKGTIFDREHIMDLQGEGANKHGYWLELPSVEAKDGSKYSISLNIDGYDNKTYELKEKRSTNKVFIPYTNLEGANGEIHLRALQKNIADIYRRSDEVGKAKSHEERVKAMGRLQEAVDSYTTQLTYDLTSSKGLFGTSVGKVKMGFTDANGSTSSANGLFKLIDPITSATQLDGEYTFISEDMAKKMGVYDAIQQNGHVYAMNNRYPTFHHDAMQITKLKIGKNVKKDEIHTTAFFSDLLKADSDGDYNNITVMQHESIQKEWAERYEKDKQIRALEIQQLKKDARNYGFTADTVMDGKPATASRVFDIDSLATAIQKEAKDKGFGEFRAGQIMDRNTAEEIAAKIGKQTIGMASNLNLQLQQVAKDYMYDDEDTQKAMMKLGQTLEQKLISSKHGAALGNGNSPALEFINAIKNSGHNEGSRDRAMYYAREYFSDLNIESDLEKTLKGLKIAQERSSQGIRNPALNAGTSGGISAREGLKKIYDIIAGNEDVADTLTSNSFINMVRHVGEQKGMFEGRERPEEYRLVEEHAQSEANRESVPMPENKIKENTREAVKNLREKTRGIMDVINQSPNLKKGLIGGGIALAGAGLYNVVSADNPIPEVNQQSQNAPIYDKPTKPAKSALPPVEQSGSYGNSQAVNVSISAQGQHGINKGQVGGMISNSLNNSGVSSSGANMHITQRDNSQKLNQIWYRDKVQENM